MGDKHPAIIGAAAQVRLVNSLAHRVWTPLDLLPTLVLGSTPQMPLVLTQRRLDPRQWAQFGPDWLREEAPFRVLWGGPTSDPAALADWAEALAGAGGELYHLLRCREALTGEGLGAVLWQQGDPAAGLAGGAAAEARHQGRPPASGEELPLHLAAALTLLGERLAFPRADPALDHGPLLAAWQALEQALERPPPAHLWPNQASGGTGVSSRIVAPVAGHRGQFSHRCTN